MKRDAGARATHSGHVLLCDAGARASLATPCASSRACLVWDWLDTHPIVAAVCHMGILFGGPRPCLIMRPRGGSRVSGEKGADPSWQGRKVM